MGLSIEEQIDRLIIVLLQEAERISKQYKTTIQNAFDIMILIELAKIHTHIDGMILPKTIREKPKHTR